MHKFYLYGVELISMAVYRKVISVFIIISVLLSVIVFPANSTVAGNGGYGLRNPEAEYKMKDCIYFGNYWQEDTNDDGIADKNDEKTPIKWIVLSTDGNEAFLMADKCLDYRRYNDNSDVSWQNSSMRTWLNNEFYNDAFNTKEQAAVKLTKVTHNNIYTLDKVYFLSSDDIRNKEYGFSRLMLQEQATDYADKDMDMQYSFVCDEGYRSWQLCRYNESDSIDYVGKTGDMHIADIRYEYDCFYVRPVLHIDMSYASDEDFAIFADAGSVEAEIEDIEYDCIYFGNYWQEDTNKDGNADKNDDKTPVKWRVLSVNGDDAFIMADRCLDYMPYNKIYSDVTWETCDIRKWLNQEFYNVLCDENEKKAVKDTYVNNSVNMNVELKKGNDTTDKIYLLSFNDMISDDYGFPERSYMGTVLRHAGNTDYAHEIRSLCEDNHFYIGIQWLLRDQKDNKDIYISDDGIIYGGYNIGERGYYIRPAMHIDLSQDVWSRAGSILVSDSGGTEKVVSLPETLRSPEPSPTQLPTAIPEPTATPKPTHNPATQPPDEQISPWPEGACYYDFDLSQAYIIGNSRYVENSDGSVTVIFKGKYPDISFHVEKEAFIDDYYRWVEIIYSDNDGYRGVRVYDKFIDYVEPWNSGTNTKYDLGYDLLPEYAGDGTAVIDISSLAEWDDYLTQIDIYAPTYSDGISDGGRITIKSIRLYSESTVPPPTAMPRPTRVPAATATPRPTSIPKATAVPKPDDTRHVNTTIPPVSEKINTAVPYKQQKLSKPVFAVRKRHQGNIKYIEIKLKKYEGEYIQVYVKNGKKKYKRVSFSNIKIKKYKGIFKVQYIKKNQRLLIKIRTYRLKKKKKIYSRYSAVKKVVT